MGRVRGRPWGDPIRRGTEAGRAAFWSMWEPISDGELIPVQILPLMKRYDIDCFETKLGRQQAAALVKSNGKQPRIFLNREDSSRRKRFSAAHELGHYVLRMKQYDEDHTFVDHRDNLSGEGTDPVEKFANAFAAELLMPESFLRREARKGEGIAVLAERFDVSIEAMGYRLDNLGISCDP